MSQPTTLVVTAIPNPDAVEAMQSYFKGVLPLLQSAGGKMVKRLKVTDVLAGQQAYGMVLVMDFESKETVSQMFDSDDYKALIPAREEGFKSMTINLAEGM